MQLLRKNDSLSNLETASKNDSSQNLGNVKISADSTSSDKDDNLNLSVKESSKETKEDLEKKGEIIPRPPNAFMIFANEWRKKLSVEHPGKQIEAMTN